MSEAKTQRNEMPAWAQTALDGALNTQPAPSPAAYAENGKVWPLLVEAALASSFMPKDLAPGVGEGAERAQAEKTVLSFAQTSHQGGGLGWSLKPDARVQIVETAGGRK